MNALAADIFGNSEEFQRWASWSNVLALPVAVVAVGVTLEKATRSSQWAVASDDQVEQAVADLAVRIEGDWAEEAARRGVTRPTPVRIRWSSTGQQAASRQVVLNDPLGGTWRQLPLRGKTDALNQEIVEAFRRLPHRQLMVLGAPGAGKTVFAVLLTLSLIRRPAADEPLPVLLPINAWNTTERVDDFVSRQLAEVYSDVLAPYGDPPALAQRLVEHRRILPILDGLDELPADAIARAMDYLDQFASAERPLVVTCRTGEYEQAVRRSRVLSLAAVVELEPVDVEDAITYLSQPTPDPRWEPVFAHLRAHPDGPLAQALSTPLMVALARSTYQVPSTADPTDLLMPLERQVATTDTTDVRTQSLTSDDATADGVQHIPDDPGHLDDDLLDDAQTAERRAVEARLVASFVPAVYAARAQRVTPDRLRATGVDYRPEQSQRWLTFLARHMQEHGVQDVGWWELARPIRNVLIASPVFLVVLVTALLFVSVAGPAAGLSIAAGSGLVAAVMMAMTGGPPQGIHATEETTPQSALSAERKRAIRRGLRDGSAFGVALGLLLAALLGLGFVYAGLVVGVFGVAYALATTLDHAWGSFLVARVWLRVTGRLPFHMASFLDDAHRRGVLRQSGARYQFRHLLLQESLAGGASQLSVARALGTERQKKADAHQSEWHRHRVRLCVVTVAALFVLFMAFAARNTPVYHSGDRPKVIQACGPTGGGLIGQGAGDCIIYIAGYRWQVGPGGRASTTFTSPSRQRVLQFRDVDGEFSLVRPDGCADAVFEWQMTIDGRLMRSGEVRAAASRLDPPGAAPRQAKTIVVSVHRTDTAPCTATLHWDHPTVLHRGVLSSG
ncbi:NACHT domain-containing protein [Phytohabitans flavus]|uniref:NACHT domain-containing protein n=1 Tax=Phytohabitans flavus TaxID=1076124 RepID=UPI0031E870BC